MKLRLLLALAAWAHASMIAYADDTVPPPWQRFQPNTTTQEWSFPDPQLPHPADNNTIYWNPNGVPIQLDTRDQGTGIEWLPGFQNRDGVYAMNPGGSILVFCIPNDPTMREEKHIWAQITWAVAPGDQSVDLEPFGGSVPPTTVEDGTDMGDGWKHSTFSYILRPNPELEYYQIRNHSNSTIYIDQVVIDTQCVPEPASLAGIAAGAAFLAKRRRR